jgi:hypothetical protein
MDTMAYLYLRKSGRVEIREAHSTPRGPRSRTLASFRGALTDEQLDRAESQSTRPFDREALRLRAAAIGVPVARSDADAETRALLARLRGGARIDPVLVSVLRAQLDECATAPLPDELADVIEWVGAGEHERGLALRDVLRLYDTIERSRDPVRETEAARFPRFSVQPERRAS